LCRHVALAFLWRCPYNSTPSLNPWPRPRPELVLNTLHAGIERDQHGLDLPHGKGCTD
jgi:hypothetical protein